MKIQQTNPGKDQATPSQASPSRHEQEIDWERKSHLPQPPRSKRSRGSTAAIMLTLMIVFALIASAIVFTQRSGTQGPQGNKGTAVSTTPVPKSTVTATPGGSDSTPTPAPGVVLGPQACPAAVKDPTYWDRIVSVPPDIVRVQQVNCGNLKGTTTLQAVVTATRIVGGGPILRNIYIFDNITAPKPTLLFKFFNLYKGEAQISGYNTIMTAEVDRASSVNKGKTDAQMKPDLFREFDWSDSEATFVQVAFPGIFPDLTRYQAELDQAQVNQGKDSWKNDAAKVAQASAVQFFHWNRSVSTTVVSGGGSHDVSATIAVKEAPIQGTQSGPNVVVTLSRLEGKTQNMWVVTAVKDGSTFTFSNIEPRSLVSSPVRFEGTGSAFEAEIGHGLVLDHLYTDIGHAILTAIGSGMGLSPYSTTIAYSTTFTQGIQEGVLEAQQSNGGLSNDVASAVLVKVLLRPEPGVALGPVPCPEAVKYASHWNPILGLNGSTSWATGVVCANLEGRPSLQAVITVFHKDTNAQDVYVFDNITAAHPVQLFTVRNLYQGYATISNYNTVLTAEVDRHSSINQGKEGNRLTADLFREFQWSDGANTFVQVAFPGIFPDLTRYQAELDQRAVNQGKDSWKNDAAKVAQNLATQLLKWSANTQTTALSGGGAQDVDAAVQVGSMGPDHPTINVTLSRLEGNTHNMWVAIAVEDGSLLSISSPAKWDRLSSPVVVKGAGSAFEGDVGTAFVLDHLYNVIGQAKGIPVSNGKTPFTATVAYTASFHGVQEGVLAFYTYSQADGAIARVVLLKVLIRA